MTRLLFLVMLVHMVILFDDYYFGDFLGDDDFLAYTFEMMNCIC